MSKNEFMCDCNSIHIKDIELAKKNLESIQVIEEMSRFFKQFSDTTRLKILSILDAVGQMCVCDIAVALNMTKSAISHQLYYLKETNSVKCVKVGKEVFYSLADSHIKDVFEKGLEHILEKKYEERV